MRYLYRFVGNRRLARARERFGSALDRWMNDWCIGAGHDRPELRVSPAYGGDSAPAAESPGLQCFRLTGAHGFLLLDETAWRALVFGADDGLPRDGTASRLLDCAIVELLRAALDATCGIKLQQDGISDDGRAWIRVGIGSGAQDPAAVRLFIDADHFSDALPVRPSRPPLQSRLDSCGNVRTTLDLRFPMAELRASELQHLRPGVVIRSLQRLEDPLQFGTADAPDLLTAFLGSRHSRKAVRIHSNLSPGKSP